MSSAEGRKGDFGAGSLWSGWVFCGALVGLLDEVAFRVRRPESAMAWNVWGVGWMTLFGDREGGWGIILGHEIHVHAGRRAGACPGGKVP